MEITPKTLFRGAALSAVATGVLFAVIQFIHPLETVANVETTRWAVTHYLGILMCGLGMIGVTGLYLRQVRESGALGLIGALMLWTFFMLTGAFQFIEAFALPELTDDAPGLVTQFLGIATGKDTGDLGAVVSLWPITGALYIGGGVLFAIASFRAAILARWASVLLAGGTLITLAIPAVSHSTARLFAFPVAAALIALGISLWRTQRSSSAATATAPATNLNLAVR
jgi:hypothetical protein